ncbi:MAG TPA: hypothetical protein DCX06_07955 [Opitutae bacterium]|nr:hypothetical protein [Opitutae bacterium]
MHARLINYLRDNRDQVIENWLTEAEVPTPNGKVSETGVVPYAFFADAFDSVVEIIESGKAPEKNDNLIHINSFIGATCDCKQRCFGGRICIELHDSGLSAFMSIFDEDWDCDHEFNQLDRTCCQDRINHALSGYFANEIEHCTRKDFRTDCPFVAQ